MHTQRTNSMIVTQLLLVCSSWLVAPATASGQSLAEIEAYAQKIARRNACTKNIETRTGASERNQWELLVSSAREFIANCLGVGLYIGHENEQEAYALSDIGDGLIEEGNFGDAVPVLQRCVTIKPDAAYCFAWLGEAFVGVGRIEDARSADEQAVSIGGYDTLNASAIKIAKARLAHMPPKGEPRHSEASKKSEPSAESKKFGTGFIVSAQGHILTNNHVVAGCETLATRDGKSLQVLSRNASSDLALLQADFKPSSVAVFRTGPSPKLGDSVIAFGFPLRGLLSSDGNVSTGILSTTLGLQNDARFIQISAPVQPGNSGGPLFDSSGHVIGVVVAKLDAVRVAQVTGDVPQNVSFAVNLAEVRAFLDDAGVPYQKGISQRSVTTSGTAAAASRIAVAIECTPFEEWAKQDDSKGPSESPNGMGPNQSEETQAPTQSLQETISWMQDFSQAHGFAWRNGKMRARNEFLPFVNKERISSQGCKVWASHDFFGAKSGEVSARLDGFSLSDIDPDSVKVDDYSDVQFETSNSFKRIYVRDALDPSITSWKLFTDEGRATGHTDEDLWWSGWLSFDSPESAQRFAIALKHAVTLCGGAKSHF